MQVQVQEGARVSVAAVLLLLLLHERVCGAVVWGCTRCLLCPFGFAGCGRPGEPAAAGRPALAHAAALSILKIFLQAALAPESAT